MFVLMIMVVLIVRVCRIGLLLGSLIHLCHLGRGQNPCLPKAFVFRALFATSAAAVYVSLLLYEPSIDRVKPAHVHNLTSTTRPVQTVPQAA